MFFISPARYSLRTCRQRFDNQFMPVAGVQRSERVSAIYRDTYINACHMLINIIYCALLFKRLD